MQKRRAVKLKRESNAAQKADIQKKILAALVKKGLVSEEKLLEEGFMSEEVQELSSHKQEGIPDEVLENPKWKISVPEVSEPEVSDPAVNVPDHNTESFDSSKLTISQNQNEDLSGRTDKDLVETKTDVKPVRNGNTKNINLNSRNTKQFSVETTKDYFNKTSRTTFKENGNQDTNYDKRNFAKYLKKMFQARKGNS